MMKVLITGAHFTPAQAVIEELKRTTDVDIVYIGRKHTIEGDKTPSVESNVLPKLGVKFMPITAGRIRRVVEFKTLISLLKIPVGFIQAFQIVKNEKPDVVVSFGGYVGVPVVFSAWLLHIPVLVHEQTLVSGLANTVSSRFASVIAVTFDQKYQFPKAKIVVTGNPLRKEIIGWKEHKNESLSAVSQEFKDIYKLAKDKKLPLILITGGNQGAHTINQTISECLPKLTEKAVVVHQTGDSAFKDYDHLSDQKASLEHPENISIHKWINAADFGFLLSHADIVISRGGANTLLELSYFSVPTLIIPLPFVNKNEQMVNAKFFSKKGLAQVLPQELLNEQTLMDKLKFMISNLDELKTRAKSAQPVVYTDAVKRLVKEIFDLAK